MNVLRIRENYAAASTQLTAPKAFLAGKKDFVMFLKMEKRLICNPGRHSNCCCKEVQITTTRGSPSIREPGLPLHLPGARDTAGTRMAAGSCGKERASVACFGLLFITPFPSAATSGSAGAGEPAASFGCRVLNRRQIYVARTHASVFSPECIWPLVFSMT